MEKEQNKLETITKSLSLNSQEKNFINFLNNINQNLEKAKSQLGNNENDKARDTINNAVILIKDETIRLQTATAENITDQITDLTTKIKFSQEKYASALSKHESIKSETIKRQERIKNIDIEIQNWKNLKFNSEKMSKELHGRLDKIKTDLENIAKLPETIAVKKGQLMQNTSDTENKKLELSNELTKAEEDYHKNK